MAFTHLTIIFIDSQMLPILAFVAYAKTTISKFFLPRVGLRNALAVLQRAPLRIVPCGIIHPRIKNSITQKETILPLHYILLIINVELINLLLFNE